MQEIPPLPETVQAVMVFQEIVMPILGVGAISFLGWLGFRTWDRQLQRRHAGGGTVDLEALRHEVERLREHAGLAEDLALRMGEVEERLDFAERVLTAKRQPELPEGGAR